jgi:hypothetical protein
MLVTSHVLFVSSGERFFNFVLLDGELDGAVLADAAKDGTINDKRPVCASQQGREIIIDTVYLGTHKSVAFCLLFFMWIGCDDPSWKARDLEMGGT